MSIQWTRAEARLFSHLHTSGPVINSTAIQCYGTFGSLLSFENVNTHLMGQVADHFGDVSFVDYRNEDHQPVPGFECHSFVNPTAKIGIFHGVAQEDLLRIMAGHQFRIGCLVCDADIIPLSEISICNQCFDLVVIPSTFCQRVFRQSGLKVPTLIIPHGLTSAFKPASDIDAAGGRFLKRARIN